LVHVRTLILLVVLMAVPACAPPGADTGKGPALAAIKAEPALRLTPPGARRVETIERDRASSIDGRSAAYSSGHFELSGDFADVVSFYQTELLALGWRSDVPPLLSTVDESGQAWCKPGMSFIVTLFDPKPAERYGIKITPGTIRVEAGILGTEGGCRP
jgi:hypothetical protein